MSKKKLDLEIQDILNKLDLSDAPDPIYKSSNKIKSKKRDRDETKPTRERNDETKPTRKLKKKLKMDDIISELILIDEEQEIEYLCTEILKEDKCNNADKNKYNSPKGCNWKNNKCINSRTKIRKSEEMSEEMRQKMERKKERNLKRARKEERKRIREHNLVQEREKKKKEIEAEMMKIKSQLQKYKEVEKNPTKTKKTPKRQKTKKKGKRMREDVEKETIEYANEESEESEENEEIDLELCPYPYCPYRKNSFMVVYQFYVTPKDTESYKDYLKKDYPSYKYPAEVLQKYAHMNIHSEKDLEDYYDESIGKHYMVHHTDQEKEKCLSLLYEDSDDNTVSSSEE
jgi:hypothetical protein